MEDFKEWKTNGKWYCGLYLLFDVLFWL
jgi:hypothetical protein